MTSVCIDSITGNGDVAVSECGYTRDQMVGIYQRPDALLNTFELVYDSRTTREWNP